MKAIAVTIATGDYFRYGEKAAYEVSKFMGLETRILSDEHLKWAVKSDSFKDQVCSLKFSIFDIFPDIDLVMYHDCDWRPVRPFRLSDYIASFDQFLACVDRVEGDHVKGLEKRFNLQEGTYFNAGWFVANRRHADLFRHARDNYFDYENVWFDQCVFNQVLKKQVQLVDKRLNIMDLNGQYKLSEILGYHSGINNYNFFDNGIDFDWSNNDRMV